VLQTLLDEEEYPEAGTLASLVKTRSYCVLYGENELGATNSPILRCINDRAERGGLASVVYVLVSGM
jgi:hypothetical protein